MTNKYKNVYIKDTSTIAGIYEGNGPLKQYFDKIYNKDFYYGEKSFEKAEIKLLKDSIKELGVFNIDIKLYEGIIGKLKIDIIA